ncbi:chemotaxis protein MotB [Romboutsia maritimum]|uniref:Chemotaxis protein MotB n=1 Tax=Romboutsia maritimum TaxID=2020948 RepID=A0A371IVQ2_9FIRM|nr:OmpA family protein [Romboutsia maritimum]RDY24539.1 chemotaxis protein MotB [Romboutsia maritimum]
MSRRKRGNEEEVNTEAWITTYSDTITLLLTFFILLYSMAEVDKEKMQQVSDAMQTQMVGEVNVKGDKPIKEPISDYDALVDKVNKSVKSNNLTDVVKVRQEEKGVVLQLDESILFDPGMADLKENSKAVLNSINVLLTDMKNDILVEGHTDNVPMHTEKYGSNWELSTARAVSVIRYFIEGKGLDPAKFTAKGYGEYKPLVENTTPENKAINRRVDILIVEQKETKVKGD